MKIPGNICPMTKTGSHKLKPFSGKTGASEDAEKRSGFACAKCHKTWIWEDNRLVAMSYNQKGDDNGKDAEETG